MERQAVDLLQQAKEIWENNGGNDACSILQQGCSSEKLFAQYKICQNDLFKKHLNQYNVIFLDIQWMYGNALEETKRDPSVRIMGYIQEQVIGELKKEYPECVLDTDISLPSVLANINALTKEQFIIIIDEWDCLFREDKNYEALQKEYINLLQGLFKGSPSGAFLKLAYITGIIPIKKYGTQSALNNFREHTMISPRQMAEYVGFTEREVKGLCKAHGLSFEEMQRWYDGYFFAAVYCRYAGRPTVHVDVESFQNDITSFHSADDVITLLIHMGYLAYDNKAKQVFIPNGEVRGVFLQAIKNDGWDEVIKAINVSEALLKATLAMDEKAVAQMIQEVHMKHTASLVYNNEISLGSVVALAYYSACKDYILVKEMPAGNGFADMVFILKHSL